MLLWLTGGVVRSLGSRRGKLGGCLSVKRGVASQRADESEVMPSAPVCKLNSGNSVASVAARRFSRSRSK